MHAFFEARRDARTRDSTIGPYHTVLIYNPVAGKLRGEGCARLEQAVDSQDTIPFVRLRMSEPVGRILITWDGR